MKQKAWLARIVAAVAALMLLPACAFALEGASAADRTVVLPEGVDEAAFGDNTVYYDGKYYATLTDALEGVFMSSPEGVAELYCKPGADVGGMTHGHVADSMVIYGNGAQVTSGERDLELDKYKYNRVTGKQDAAAGAFLEKDVTVTVKSLDGIAAWGERNTAHTINLVFEDCKDMQRIYFTNTANKEGVINISLDGCSFDGTADGDLVANVGTTVYSNANGDISIKNTEFKEIAVALNINHKSTGVQNIAIENCAFIDCATEQGPSAAATKTYGAPLRIVSQPGAVTNLSVSNSEFILSEGRTSLGNGDILLGDGRADAGEVQGTVTLATTGTAADVMVQKKGYFGASGEVADAAQGSMTGVAESDVVKPSEDDHFVVDTHDSVELVGAKDATCTEEGYTGDKVCTVCGKIVEQGSAIEKLAHSYKDGICTVCGAEDPDYVAPQKPSGPSDPENDSAGEGNGSATLPQTGDASFAIAGLALIALAASAVFAFVFRKRMQL